MKYFIWIGGFLFVSMVISTGMTISHLSRSTNEAINESGATSIKPSLDKETERLIKITSDYLTILKVFSFKSIEYSESMIDSTIGKTRLISTSVTYVQKPNKLKIESEGEGTGVEFYYDGKTILVYGKKHNYYAYSPAPKTIEEAIDYSRNFLNIETPAGELLNRNLFKALMENSISGKLIGKEIAGGKMCHHLAFKGNDTDWQIWIEDSLAPLPRKFMMTSKNQGDATKYCVEFLEWNINIKLHDELFTFIPPNNATMVEFNNQTVSNKQ